MPRPCPAEESGNAADEEAADGTDKDEVLVLLDGKVPDRRGSDCRAHGACRNSKQKYGTEKSRHLHVR